MSKTCVYIAMHSDGGPLKVGIASDVFKRLAQLQTGNPVRLEIFAVDRFSDRATARAIEARMHQLLEPHVLCGEWFGCDLDDASYARETAVCEQMEARGIRTSEALAAFYEPLICKAPPNG